MEYTSVYFIGIGGIGMSAIARYYKFKGLAVSGYDKTPSDLTAALEREGIAVHYESRPDLIPADTQKTLVVYTPAVPKDFPEFLYVQQKGYRVIKRSRMLGEIAAGQDCLAVAGTHGKTTTSTLTAHILTQTRGCTAFLGGISKNYRTNLLTSHNPVVVAEADEFDRSFLQLFPKIAVITAMDADHLDIYGDLQQYQQAFRDFAAQVSGTLIVKKGLPLTAADTKAGLKTYHASDPAADFHAENARADACGHFTYDLRWPGGLVRDIRVGIPGRINVENSVGAAAIALSYGLDPEAVKAAIGSFQGVLRRLDVHLNTPGLSYIIRPSSPPPSPRCATSSPAGS